MYHTGSEVECVFCEIGIKNLNASSEIFMAIKFDEIISGCQPRKLVRNCKYFKVQLYLHQQENITSES
jgi:hypothetical protein